MMWQSARSRRQKLQEGDKVICVHRMDEAETAVFKTERDICLRIQIGDIPLKKKGRDRRTRHPLK